MPVVQLSVLHRLEHRKPSAEYRAWVDGEEAYVFNQTGFAGGTMSWIYLDLHQPVTIHVQPHRMVDEVRVLPRRCQIAATIHNNGVTLRIEKPGSYQLEWDQNLELPFFIFARPPESATSGLLAAPASASESSTDGTATGKRISFEPGEHCVGRIVLNSGDELHLASGAEVYGAIYAKDATNIRITGRGTLRQSHLRFGGRGDERHPIELIGCRDVLIEGIMVIEGCTWNVVFRDCDRVHVRHITVLSERPYSTDGINPCDSREVLVEHCFIRCKDDCISIKGMQRNVPLEALKPIHDIEVRDCVFWSDNNNGLVVGTETWASEISHIYLHRIDFIRVTGTCGDWAAAFAVQALADTHIHNIVFEDIEVEYCTGNPFAIFYLDVVYGIPGQRRKTGALMEKITFRNITFHTPVKRRSIIKGMNDLCLVKNVTFAGISNGGKAVQGADDLRLQTNEFAEAIHFDEESTEFRYSTIAVENIPLFPSV